MARHCDRNCGNFDVFAGVSPTRRGPWVNAGEKNTTAANRRCDHRLCVTRLSMLATRWLTTGGSLDLSTVIPEIRRAALGGCYRELPAVNAFPPKTKGRVPTVYRHRITGRGEAIEGRHNRTARRRHLRIGAARRQRQQRRRDEAQTPRAHHITSRERHTQSVLPVPHHSLPV